MATNQRPSNRELADWLDARQSRLKIAKTTTTPSGRVLDWIPIESQVASGKVASPPPAPVAAPQAEDGERPVRLATVGLEGPAADHGPAGTVPIVRPDIARLDRYSSLNDFLSHTKKGGQRVGWRLHGARPVDPDPDGYFHSQISEFGAFYGWEGRFSVWDPAINHPGPGNDHSILQAWVLNDAVAPRQSLEGGWTVDQSLNGDTQAHIFTYFTTNNYAADGDNIGGYNTEHRGFVQYSSPSTTGAVVFPGIRINGASTPGGQQLEVSMKFQLYQEPGTTELNWWVAVQGIWMGYYPATLYGAGGMATGANLLSSGGEVFSGLGNPEATGDQMGSGVQADEGWTHAAFLRLLQNQVGMNGATADSNGVGSNDPALPGGPDPYTNQTFMRSGGSWRSYFFAGGPTP
jgi:hypothetical protein